MKNTQNKMFNLSKHSTLLSHHKPSEYYRCLKLKDVYICARCFGVHSALYPTLFYQIFVHPFSHSFTIIILYLFPFFSFLDWGLYKFNVNKGNNISRVISGLFLGICIGTMFYIFLEDILNQNLWISASIYSVLGLVICKLSSPLKG